VRENHELCYVLKRLVEMFFSSGLHRRRELKKRAILMNISPTVNQSIKFRLIQVVHEFSKNNLCNI
jgi:hypothetical protein